MPFKHPELLSPPIARAAYSDRTAWLMAEMSSLAYLKFEGSQALVSALADRLVRLEDRDKIRQAIATFIADYTRAEGGELATLHEVLHEAAFELIATFNNGGTQAFLAKRDSDHMAVLAFRGTEPTELRDIRVDLNARFFVRDGVKVHDGFRRAFALVEPAVTRAVTSVANYKLYVTGHSLGGALALIATRALNSDNVAACYTFGSPRVGDIEFDAAIKVPIYRIVNAADAVPHLPPTWSLELAVLLAGLIPVPYLRGAMVRFLKRFVGYRHHGDMRYLTACRDDFSDLRLIANPDFIDKTQWMLHRLIGNLRAGLTDHAVEQYRRKLEAYALRRQR